jgi:prepilin-type N-terminal cleavage/methylation domain-containing protein
MKRAFTILELLVALGVMVIMMSIATVVFSYAVKSHRSSNAGQEIIDKLQTATSRIDSDIEGLRKDGRIFITWAAHPRRDAAGNIIDTDADGIPDTYDRFDRIMFFASGDFETYEQQRVNGLSGPEDKYIRGNLARICYMIANGPSGTGTWQPAYNIAEPAKRILARSQNIYTAMQVIEDTPGPIIQIFFPDILDPAFSQPFFAAGQLYPSYYEFDTDLMSDWISTDSDVQNNVYAALEVLCGVDINPASAELAPAATGGPVQMGIGVDKETPDTLAMYFTDGCASFSVQGWLESENRWFPSMDPDGDGNYADSDFYTVNNAGKTIIDETRYIGLLYPNPGGFWNGGNSGLTPPVSLDQANFKNIPGLGRALKFTFRFYDPDELIQGGKVFTHIVYID